MNWKYKYIVQFYVFITIWLNNQLFNQKYVMQKSL